MGTTNPYAAPGGDEEVKSWKADQRYLLAALGLGVAWWAALLVPEMSREILLEGGVLQVAWGIARVMTIVVVASLLYGRMRDAWPSTRWLSALVCLWLGCAVFAFTIAPGSVMTVFLVFWGPPLFLVKAFYVVLPLLFISGSVLGRLLARARASA